MCQAVGREVELTGLNISTSAEGEKEEGASVAKLDILFASTITITVYPHTTRNVHLGLFTYSFGCLYF